MADCPYESQLHLSVIPTKVGIQRGASINFAKAQCTAFARKAISSPFSTLTSHTIVPALNPHALGQSWRSGRGGSPGAEAVLQHEILSSISVVATKAEIQRPCVMHGINAADSGLCGNGSAPTTAERSATTWGISAGSTRPLPVSDNLSYVAFGGITSARIRNDIVCGFGGRSYDFQAATTFRAGLSRIYVSFWLVAIAIRAAQCRPVCCCGVILGRRALSSADVLAWPPGHRGMPWRRFPGHPDVVPGVAVCPPESVGWAVHASLRLMGFHVPVSFPVFSCRFRRGHPLRGTTGPGLVKDLPAQSARSSWTSS